MQFERTFAAQFENSSKGGESDEVKEAKAAKQKQRRQR
jgi:hypothetical protein